MARFDIVDESTAPAWPEQYRVIGMEAACSRRVLLVDDEPENLEVLSALLEDDFEVHLAQSGREALGLIDSLGDFAVVISDQRMPGMTGVELLSDIARRAPTTVRMVLSAYSDLGPIVAAVNEGRVYRFFLKPWNPHEMRAAVADAVWMYAAEGALGRLVAMLSTRKRDLATTLAHLKRSQNELLASERMSTLGRFSAGITHNIRNNLTVMMHVLDIVQQKPTHDGLVRSAEHAFGTLESLLHLANDVNALARGRFDALTCGPVQLRPFLERIATAFARELHGKDRTVTITVSADARILSFDELRITKAVLAVLRRVAEASPTTAAIEMLVHPLSAEGEACIEVWADTQGRPEARPPAVATLEPEANRSPELALGLEVARVVAEAHGGRLVEKRRTSAGDSIELWLGKAGVRGQVS